MAYPTSYLVFDFETTGLDSFHDRIVQVGLCEVRNGEVTRMADWLVNQDVEIPPEASRIHGITTETMRRDGVQPDRSLEVLLRAMRAAPVCLGHNIHRFDVQFLEAECARLGMEPPDCEYYVDTAALFKGWRLNMTPEDGESGRAYANRVLSIPVKGLKYSVQTCIQVLGIEMGPGPLHDAGTDTYMTHLIMKSMCSVLSPRTEDPASSGVMRGIHSHDHARVPPCGP